MLATPGRTTATNVSVDPWERFVPSKSQSCFFSYGEPGLSYYRKLCGGGEIVVESGDRPCKDHNNEDRNPGDTWLTGDSCNICSCKGKQLHLNPSRV